MLFCVGVRCVRVAHPVNGRDRVQMRSSRLPNSFEASGASRANLHSTDFPSGSVLCPRALRFIDGPDCDDFVTHDRGAGSRSRASETRTTDLKSCEREEMAWKGWASWGEKFSCFFSGVPPT